MTDIPYSNRELDEKLHTIHEKLDLILAQTTRTNGRVSEIEKSYVTIKDVAPLYQWKSYSTGAVAVLVAIVLPILGYVFYEVLTKVH